LIKNREKREIPGLGRENGAGVRASEKKNEENEGS
jgi:hypothetical protein